jgi:hypothetical protein
MNASYFCMYSRKEKKNIEKIHAIEIITGKVGDFKVKIITFVINDLNSTLHCLKYHLNKYY